MVLKFGSLLTWKWKLLITSLLGNDFWWNFWICLLCLSDEKFKFLKWCNAYHFGLMHQCAQKQANISNRQICLNHPENWYILSLVIKKDSWKCEPTNSLPSYYKNGHNLGSECHFLMKFSGLLLDHKKFCIPIFGMI